MIFLYIILLVSSILSQVKPYKEPNYIINDSSSNQLEYISYNDINKPISINLSNNISQHLIELPENGLYNISVNHNDIQNLEFYLIDIDKLSFIGPYNFIGNNTKIVTTDPLNTKKFVLEVNGYIPNYKNHSIIVNINHHINKVPQNIMDIKVYHKRENPTILVTGYWPPSNEMIRHFSQDQILNPSGWQGENWEESGYNIISYFPTFDDPGCSSCGQGNGILQVDYQNTSDDFWPIFNSHNPIAIITFSRGSINHSWELEYNYYNRTNWYNDYSSPFLPTPNPPDSEEDAYFLRNSNLPMENIVENINNLNIGLDSYIDVDGDPGHFVSEFMGYHGVWYRDINLSGELKCFSAGHVHVGGQIDTETARLAADETIRTLINYLNQFAYNPGDANLDSIVDVLDLVVIINYILGNGELSTIQFFASDLNEDGIINIQDIILIINIILNN